MKPLTAPRLAVLLTLLVASAFLLAPGSAAARHTGVDRYVDRGFVEWSPEIFSRCDRVFWGWRDASPNIVGWVDAPESCTFYLNRRLLRQFHYESGLLCTVVIHEMGHLAGYGHTYDPRSIMYPDYGRSSAC